MILPPVGTPPTPITDLAPEPGSISPTLDLAPREINPNARELLAAQNNVAPLEGFEQVTPSFQDAGGAKLIDLNAREKLGGFEHVAPAESLPGFEKADDLDVKSVDELNLNREGFNPVTYLQSNPNVAQDPKKLQKLLDVYRKRRDEGLVASEVVKSAFKETPGLIGNIAGGIKRLGERAIDLTVQPVSNVVLGALTGDLFDEQKRSALFNETRKIVKKGAAEVSAGSEAATVGLVDLSRQGFRKLDAAFQAPPQGSEFESTPIPAKKPKTDQELLSEISDDVAFRQNAAEILTGQGEAAKKLGLDKETLAKQGIELDEKAIEQLSLVDPLTMVATGGAFKLVGLGGKVLATAKTLQGAEQAAEKLAQVAKISLTRKVVGKTIQGGGKVLTGAGTLLKGSGPGLGTVAGIATAVSGGGITPALIVGGATRLVGPAIRKVGPVIEHAGQAIAGEVPVSAALQKVADYAAIPGRVAGEVTKGALTGIVAAAPFAVMADEDQQAGALFGAGGALGAAHATVALPLRVVKEAAARNYFGENRPLLPDVPSPGYGDATADALHQTQMQKLSAQDASEVNNFRELLRPLGKKILAVDVPTFRAKIKEIMPDVTPEQLDIFENHSAFFDSKDTVYLNSDATGLHHDAGHLFDALLTPEKRTELRSAITDAFGQKSIDDFKATYERRVGSKISDAAALDEYIAEQFNALFNNVPVTELAAPKSLLKKFVDTVAEGAETLGVDLTGGATTPLLGAPVSVGIRKLFQNAAGEVARASIEAKAAAPAPAPAAPAPVSPPTFTAPTPELQAQFETWQKATGQTPAAPAPPAPAPPAPSPPAPAPNIRVTPEQVGAFTRPTEAPAARAAAAARAAETGVDYARAEAKKDDGSPTSRIIEQISDAMESGKPVIGIEHLGITSESTPAAPAGRTPRRAEQASGYAALEAAQLDVRQNAPTEIVAQHSKNFVPVRWTDQGGTPTLIAMSLDKVISNILKIAADPKAKDLIPYATENGKLTPEGWREVVADAQAYSENQANGRKGDGGRLEVPEAGLSIPAENPTYTPKTLSPARADFQNLVQGLAPPQTSRAQAGVMPGNVKGQILAEANRRAVELPANIPTKQAGKQAFAEFPPRVVQEVNPLRNALEKAGVNTRNLLEVTERIRAKDIVSAKTRPDVNYQAPVTDVIRGGFAPGPEKFRAETLGAQSVEDFSNRILTLSPAQWSTEAKAMTGGLTGGAWDLGLGLKTPDELATLKSFADKATEAGKTAMNAGDFDTAGSQFTRAQFFREAYEAATGTGGAGLAFTKGAAGEFKPPFADKQRIAPPEETPRFAPKPSEELQKLAKEYADDAGIPYAPKGDYVEVKPEVAKELAEFYDKAKSDPTNPEVAASYDALIRETEEQGKAILAAGYKIEPWTGAGEPYKNSAAAVADVRNNKHLFFLKTEGSFGTGESNTGNPMLRESTIVPGQVANDVFRWVHDFFGHAKGDFQFGPRGEFNAWRAHSELFSTEAQGALAAETLAQNSWVNYGSHLEGKNIPLAERPFAEQKNIVIPRELIDKATFAPKTESGRALEERGYEIVPSGELGMRRVSIVTPSGAEIAAIQSVQRSPKNAEISLVTKVKGAPKGLGEVLYREVGAQLKEDGVTKITGQVIAPEPLAIRKKIFGDFSSIDINGEPATYEQALATSERLRAGYDNELASIEPVNRITASTRFAPGKRDAQGRPLNKAGEIDYAKWQKEGLAARKKQQAEPIADAPQTGPVTESTKATGWILPSKEFVPMDTEYHEQYLQKNSESLNERFGTKFKSEESSADDRLDALKAGFVRLRNYSGKLSIEANSAKWPALKRKVLETLQDREGQIDSLTVSLLNDDGQQVDSTTAARLFEMTDTDKLNAIEEAVNTVRPSGPRFAPSVKLLSGDEKSALNPEDAGVGNYWLSPSGKFFRAGDHKEWASARLSEPVSKKPEAEQAFKNNGWLRLSRERERDFGDAIFIDGNSASEKQKNALETWAGSPDMEGVEIVDSRNLVFKRPSFAPGPGLPGFEDVSAEQAGRLKAKRRIAAVKKNNPEAISPKYARDENGEIIVSADGNPKPLTLDYDFINSPVAKEAAKGLKGAAREAAAADALGDALTALHRSVEDRPDIKAGAKWYSTARTRLRKVFGNDSKLFAELLGATSARTPVETNYRFALDAYNQFKAGAFDETLAKYREGKAAWDSQDLGDFTGETRGQFMDFWVNKHDLGVTQASGKKYGMNSRAVLRVLDGSWAAEVQGPKTPNFAGNLTGETFEATIDVWAARLLHRLANEGKTDRWRILPENETGVTDADFYLGQAAYRNAAKQLGIKPDALQAILWFSEKDHWEKHGWTRGAGAAKSDFNVLLAETERTPSGSLQMKTPQAEFGLDMGASLKDIVKKKK